MSVTLSRDFRPWSSRVQQLLDSGQGDNGTVAGRIGHLLTESKAPRDAKICVAPQPATVHTYYKCRAVPCRAWAGLRNVDQNARSLD